MPIYLNNIRISVNKLNGRNVSEEKLNGTAVYTRTLQLRWEFVISSSSIPASSTYDFITNQYINGDYEQGIYWLDMNMRDGYHDGYVAVINDYSSREYFTFVAVYD